MDQLENEFRTIFGTGRPPATSRLLLGAMFRALGGLSIISFLFGFLLMHAIGMAHAIGMTSAHPSYIQSAQLSLMGFLAYIIVKSLDD